MFSRYVEIDGKPYVMEMLKKLDEDTLIDAVGYGKMVQKLSVYNDKLYSDVIRTRDLYGQRTTYLRAL